MYGTQFFKTISFGAFLYLLYDLQNINYCELRQKLASLLWAANRLPKSRQTDSSAQLSL